MITAKTNTLINVSKTKTKNSSIAHNKCRIKTHQQKLANCFEHMNESNRKMPFSNVNDFDEFSTSMTIGFWLFGFNSDGYRLHEACQFAFRLP